MNERANRASSWFGWALAALLILQFAGILSVVIRPLSLLSEEPLTQADYPNHIYHGISWSNATQASHPVWGYDPFWMGGYPIGVSTEILDNKPSSWFILAAARLHPYRAYKFYIFLSFLAVPAIILYSGRALRLSLFSATMAAVLALDFWYWDPDAKYPVQYGSTELVLASVLAPLVAAAFISWSERGGRGWLAWVVLPLAFLVHGASPVIYMPIMALTFACWLTEDARRYITRVVLLGIVVLLVNAIWLVPFLLRSVPLLDKIAYPYHQTQGWAGLLGIKSDVYLWLRPLLLVAGAWGIVRWWRDGQRARATVFAGSAFILFIMSNFGTSLGVSFLQPRRFWSALGFLLTLPAGTVFGALAEKVRVERPFRAKIIQAALFAGLALPLLYTAFLRPWVRPLLSRSFDRPPPWLEIKIPPHMQELTDWVHKTIPQNERILIETYFDREGESSSYQALLPLDWKRELIGNPYPWGIIIYERVSFYEGILMGKPIQEYSPEQLKSLFTLYDIRHALVFSRKSREVFSGQPWLETLACPDPFYAAFTDRRPSERFIKGSGNITANFGAIHVQGASPGGIIIRYHWISGLKTVPVLPIRSFPVPGDPIGFIEVLNGDVKDFYIK